MDETVLSLSADGTAHLWSGFRARTLLSVYKDVAPVHRGLAVLSRRPVPNSFAVPEAWVTPVIGKPAIQLYSFSKVGRR